MLLPEILRGNALNYYLAAVVFIKSAKHIKQGGFTAARFTQQENHTLFGKLKAYFIKRRNRHAFFRFINFNKLFCF